jgi:hypothetical protein
MLTVHVRVNDAATAKPTPVRLRILDASGRYFPPLGRLAQFATGPGEDVGGNVRVGPADFSYIDGTCEVRLPAGPVVVEVFKGPEYLPVRREITLGPGQISVRLAIERWVNPATQRWYSGDARCHELGPHAALLEGAAEGLAYVHLLARECPGVAGRPGAFSQLLAFSGTRPALEGSGCAVVVNTLNEHPVLGSVALLNCHRVVYPLRFGALNGDDGWSVADWCDQCHRKSGLVVWSDLPRMTAEHTQGEALAASVLGKVDAFEVASFPEPEPDSLGDWYRLLDCGCRVALAGSSGKESNAVALGCVRTYACIPADKEPGVSAWIDAVRAGRTFITNGPLIFLSVDDGAPGSVLSAPVQGRRVRIHAWAQSAVPFDNLEVLVGGEILASKSASGNRLAAELYAEVDVKDPTWVAARCWSAARLPDGQCAYAHTSPVYIELDGRQAQADRQTVASLCNVLEQTGRWVENDAVCPTEHRKEHLRTTLAAAIHELIKRQRA